MFFEELVEKTLSHGGAVSVLGADSSCSSSTASRGAGAIAVCRVAGVAPSAHKHGVLSDPRVLVAAFGIQPDLSDEPHEQLVHLVVQGG